jgi:hypothetical protein
VPAPTIIANPFGRTGRVGVVADALATVGAWPGAWLVAIAVALPCLPLAVAVAVLRYRLWDLDRLVQGSGSLAVVDQTMQPTRASLWPRKTP